MISKKLWMTAGYITISLGLYMLYKGSDLDINIDDIIDVEFKIVD